VKVEIHDASFLENVNDHGNSMMTTSLTIKVVSIMVRVVSSSFNPFFFHQNSFLLKMLKILSYHISSSSPSIFLILFSSSLLFNLYFQ